MINRQPNVCPAEKRTKHSSNILLRLVRFFAGQTLLKAGLSEEKIEFYAMS